MAYAVPKVWVHGDVLVAADLNKYRDGLNEIRNKSKDRAINFCFSDLRGGFQPGFGNTQPLTDDCAFYFVHKRRLLWFKGKGKVMSLDGTKFAPVSVDSGWSSYDLDSVSWLAYGMLYRVVGVGGCVEW